MGVGEGGVSLIVELDPYAVHNEQFHHNGFMLPDLSTFLLQVCTSLKHVLDAVSLEDAQQ